MLAALLAVMMGLVIPPCRAVRLTPAFAGCVVDLAVALRRRASRPVRAVGRGAAVGRRGGRGCVAICVWALAIGGCKVRFEPPARGSGGGPVADAGRDETDTDGPGPACVPQTEVCNDQDDDCDGQVDEGFEPVACGVGSCRRTVSPCPEAPDCVPGSPGPEVCDGDDNDCDGATDEDDAGDVLMRSCYTGPDGTAGVGACTGGARACDSGEFGGDDCSDEVLPVAEVDGNDVDDDCNGLVDDGFAALWFAGTAGSRVDLPGHRDFELVGRSFTIEAWVAPSEVSFFRSNTIVSRRADGDGTGWMFGVVGRGNFDGLESRTPFFLIDDWPQESDDGGAYISSKRSHLEIEDRHWYHLAATFDHEGGKDDGEHRLALFGNGVLLEVDDEVERGLSAPSRNLDMLVGVDRRRATNAFTGWIADLRISSVDRWPESPDCRKKGDRCFEPPGCFDADEHTLGYWRLAEGAGGTAYDVSTHEHHGDIIRAEADVRWSPSAHCSTRQGGAPVHIGE